MHFTELPAPLRIAIDAELVCLNKTIEYDIPSENLINIYRLIGPSCNPSFQETWLEHRYRILPDLTKEDRVRVQIALATARKLIPYWTSACEETDRNFMHVHRYSWKDETELEKAYLERFSRGQFEDLDVYTEIPRKYTVSHILKLAEVALTRSVNNVVAFREQAGEWWQIYPRPELSEREFFIKWAVQEALYEAIGLNRHWEKAPAQHAVRAYAGVFYGQVVDDRHMKWDYLKLNEFWRWWLTEAIPTAWELEYKIQ